MATHPFAAPRTPMEARVRETLPEPPGWAYEPKWDGFRALAWSGAPPRLDSRNQRPLLRYFPELETPLGELPAGTVVDGEVVVVTDDQLDFDALQLRLHPADSRTAKLADEIPASIVTFDLLAVDGRDLRGEPFESRRVELERLVARLSRPWRLTPTTVDVDVARRWFTEFESAGCDGIVAKRVDGPYVEGRREMRKVKHRRSVDAVVGGYRVHKDTPGRSASEGGMLGSLLLGLYDAAGNLHFVGHCSGFSDTERTELLAHFERRSADASFAGGRVPGEPSRWSRDKDRSWTPVSPEVVLQVSYDQLTGGRFRHATRLERWRPDKDPGECTFEQLARPAGPGFGEVVEG